MFHELIKMLVTKSDACDAFSKAFGMKQGLKVDENTPESDDQGSNVKKFECAIVDK